MTFLFKIIILPVLLTNSLGAPRPSPPPPPPGAPFFPPPQPPPGSGAPYQPLSPPPSGPGGPYLPLTPPPPQYHEVSPSAESPVLPSLSTTNTSLNLSQPILQASPFGVLPQPPQQNGQGCFLHMHGGPGHHREPHGRHLHHH